MPVRKHHVVAVAALLAAAPMVMGSIGFDVSGLAGTGVTAHVDMTYTSTSATAATLRFVIENTTAVGGRISGFAFNTPSLAGATFSSIGGGSNGSGVITLAPGTAVVTPENQVAGSNESGWFGLWANNSIKTPNAAGHFDFGVLNDGANANKFLTGGTGSGPRILNTSNSNDSTAFVLQLTGTGLNLGDATIEQAFMNALSSPQNANGGTYSFAVRFQGIDGSRVSGQDSDLAVTSTVVPAPTAAALGALGLGLVGWARRRIR